MLVAIAGTGTKTMCWPPSALVSAATLRVFSTAAGEILRTMQAAGPVDGAAGDSEAPPGKLVGELIGIGGQVAVGSELDPAVAGLGSLVEESMPGSLVRIIREPHPPGVRRSAQGELIAAGCTHRPDSTDAGKSGRTLREVRHGYQYSRVYGATHDISAGT